MGKLSVKTSTMTVIKPYPQTLSNRHQQKEKAQSMKFLSDVCSIHDKSLLRSTKVLIRGGWVGGWVGEGISGYKKKQH